MLKILKKSNRPDFGEADKIFLIHLLQEQILLLKEKNKRLGRKLRELEARLNKNSRNSSKPPSSDTKKPKRTESLRKKSDKNPGGQPGHSGKTLKVRTKPDETIHLPVTNCGKCNKSLKNMPETIEIRQEFEIPEPKILVKEYQAASKTCSCGHVTSACFPKHITNKTQYGINAKSLMVYMNQYQFLPYHRCSEFFETIYGHKISPATVVNANKLLNNRSKQVEKDIKLLLSKAELVNCDETSMKVSSQRKWLHTVGNNKLTHYALHKKRGSDATNEIGILSEFLGIMIHDHWKSYFQYKRNTHGLCNAHHLRELKFLNEQHKMKWAKKMSCLLLKIKKHKERFLEKEKGQFTSYLFKKYSTTYDTIILGAHKEQAFRGTIDSHNLIKRLSGFKKEALLFMCDFNVPFTNNLSERDLRMSKVKQKISGCFRSTDGSEAFCRIRSMLSTAKKNSKNIFSIIQKAFSYNITAKSLLTV